MTTRYNNSLKDPGFIAFQAQAAKYPLLSREEERRLIAGYQTSKAVYYRDTLIQAHLRFVSKVAIQHARRTPSIPVMDYVQAGVEGLYQALEKFDLTAKTRFLTYAVWWIRVSMGRERGRQLNAGLTGSYVSRGHELKVLSLDAPVITEDGEAWTPEHYGLSASDAPTPEAKCEQYELVEYALGLFLSAKREVERDIVWSRIINWADQDRTLEQIGRTHGMTRERVRQLELVLRQKLDAVINYPGKKVA